MSRLCLSRRSFKEWTFDIILAREEKAALGTSAVGKKEIIIIIIINK